MQKARAVEMEEAVVEGAVVEAVAAVAEVP
jgi:hypothetical protein